MSAQPLGPASPFSPLPPLQMQQRGIEPTAWTYNALLNVECWTYGVDAGVALLQSLVARGVQPDRATWNTLLACAPP